MGGHGFSLGCPMAMRPCGGADVRKRFAGSLTREPGNEGQIEDALEVARTYCEAVVTI